MEGGNRSRRPVVQPYVPVHRRNKQEQVVLAASPTSSRTLVSSLKDEIDVKRRGRGQFRAPSNENFISPVSTEEQVPVVQEQVTPNPVIEQADIQLDEQVEVEEEQEEQEEWETSLNLDVKAKLAVKPVIEKPLTETTSDMLDDEATTVLDCFDFPNSFKTFHLKDIFKEYESMRGGYEIKWMDDTRALIIFEHPYTAKKAYIENLTSPLFKLKPYKGQIDRKPTGPIPRRPVTTDMVAKRLVHNALGVRTTKTPEQRQAEKDLLKATREQRHAQKARLANREKAIADAFNE